MLELFTEPLPDRWQEIWKTMKVTEDVSWINETPLTLEQWLEEIYFDEERVTEFTKEDIDKIGELVRRMMRYEPSSRALAHQILDDPWFERERKRAWKGM